MTKHHYEQKLDATIRLHSAVWFSILEALGPETARRRQLICTISGSSTATIHTARSCVPVWPTRNWKRSLGGKGFDAC